MTEEIKEQIIKDYKVYFDEQYLTSEKDIIPTFEDIGREYLDCGQGYGQDEATVYCLIGQQFYKVEIKASLGSAKQDVGDRLYWVEDIDSITFERVELKPIDKKKYSFELILTEQQHDRLQEFLKELL